MTVKELIELLQKQDPDYEVWLEDQGGQRPIDNDWSLGRGSDANAAAFFLHGYESWPDFYPANIQDDPEIQRLKDHQKAVKKLTDRWAGA
jgi:hypothetical protein